MKKAFYSIAIVIISGLALLFTPAHYLAESNTYDYSIADIVILSIPDSFSGDEDDTDSTKILSNGSEVFVIHPAGPWGTDYYTQFILESILTTSNFTDSDLLEIDNALKEQAMSLDVIEDSYALKTEMVQVASFPGKKLSFLGKVNGNAIMGESVYFYIPEKDTMVFLMMIRPLLNGAISDDLDKIISSARKVESSSDSKTFRSSAKGNSSDFKETMDGYKSFFQRYVAFIQRYNNPENTDKLSMLQDYQEYLAEYTETMDSLNKIDQESLSSEELNYYFETMKEVHSILLGLYEP